MSGGCGIGSGSGIAKQCKDPAQVEEIQTCSPSPAQMAEPDDYSHIFNKAYIVLKKIPYDVIQKVTKKLTLKRKNVFKKLFWQIFIFLNDVIWNLFHDNIGFVIFSISVSYICQI